MAYLCNEGKEIYILKSVMHVQICAIKIKAMSTRILKFLKPHVFIWIRFDGVLNCSGQSKHCGFGVWIHWFRVGEGKRWHELAEWHVA